MNDQEALEIIESALKKTTKKNPEKIIGNENLLTSGILDSVDSLMFPINIKKITGLAMPKASELTTNFFEISQLKNYLIEESKKQSISKD